MLVKVRQLLNGKYRVTNDGKISAKATTRTKALNQQKLLRALEHGYNPSQRRHRRGKGKGRII